jgi:hypothetical protein
MTFDQWNCEPCDEPCEHEHADVDTLTGMAYCPSCGEGWWLSAEELKRELEIQAQAYEAFAAEMSGEEVFAPEECPEGTET